MTRDDALEQRLAELGNALSQHRSIVTDVMSRTANRRMPSARSPSIFQWRLSRLWPPQLATTAIAASIALLAAYLFLSEQRSASVFADQALAALEHAKAEGVTIEERTMVVLRDGSRHTSSTSDTYFVGQNSYRRDIRDGDHLREIQWYTRKGDGMLQTSMRFDSITYTLQSHTGGYGDEHPVARMSMVVGFIDKADRRLDPLMVKGRQCLGFEIRASKYGDNPENWVDRIWFDPDTKLPVRIELERPKTDKDIKAFITIQDHFDWRPDLPADTFIPKIPDGFMMRQEHTDAANRESTPP